MDRQTVTQSAQPVQHSHGNPNPATDYNRRKEHGCAALRLLEYLRQAAREGKTPSTAELQAEQIFGLRPVNRIGDLIRGKYGPRYDIEKLDCGHGVYRWRLHEPNRPGYPKTKEQGVLPLPAPPPTPWKDRKPVTGLELWDAAGVR